MAMSWRRRSRRPVWSAFPPTPSTASAGWSRRPPCGRSRAPRDAAPTSRCRSSIRPSSCCSTAWRCRPRSPTPRAACCRGRTHWSCPTPTARPFRPAAASNGRPPTARREPRRPSCGRWACACRLAAAGRRAGRAALPAARLVGQSERRSGPGGSGRRGTGRARGLRPAPRRGVDEWRIVNRGRSQRSAGRPGLSRGTPRLGRDRRDRRHARKLGRTRAL